MESLALKIITRAAREQAFKTGERGALQ